MSDESHLWTLEQACNLMSVLTSLLEPDYFCALAGGCLRRGWSDKDVDIVILPRTAGSVDLFEIHYCLLDAGLTLRTSADDLREEWQARGHVDHKHVEIWELEGKRIDVIIGWPIAYIADLEEKITELESELNDLQLCDTCTEDAVRHVCSHHCR